MEWRFGLSEKVASCLKSNIGDKFTAYQIAKWILETYPRDCAEKRQRSKQNLEDDVAFIRQLQSEIGTDRQRIQKKHSQIKITVDRPRKYYYSTQSDEDEVAQAEAGQRAEGVAHASAPRASSPQLYEHDLYPLLARYLWEEHRVFATRIDEKKSSNTRGSKGNHWLHPDIVGMEDLGREWRSEVRECASAYPDRRASLWSFEVKLLLNGSNARESFFQALSNSSWANFAYLVAKDIDDGEPMKELRMLSAAHGIGLIKLNVEDPSDSEVLIPARERAAVDWDMVSRLARENSDFREFVGRISSFCKTNKTREWRLAIAAEWGLSDEED